MFAQLLSVFAASVALANAYPPPVGNPSGNPISRPSLNEIVPAGQAYTITWNPTTADTIALVLLRGPSTNVVPIATIVDNIQNTGTYDWTPSTDLEPDTTHYGLQLICDDTGAYQYSTQFGISNPNYTGNSSSSASGSMSGSMTMSGSMSGNGTMSMTSSASYSASTGSMVSNSSIVSPTISMSKPTTLTSTSTGTPTGGSKTSSSSAAATQSSQAGSMKLSVGGAVAALAVAVAAL